MKKFRLFLKSKITVDTLAFVIFSICTSVGLTTLYELLVVRMENETWVIFRILYNLLKFSGAYFCAEITDWVRLKVLKKSENLFRKAIADSISVSMYQLPLYNVSGFIMGIDTFQLMIISSIYLLDNILLGWSYGAILDWIRKKF